jgi:hypothetical protein
LIKGVEQPLGDDAAQQRLQHEAFVRQLRNIATSTELAHAPQEDPSRKLFDALVDWIFLKADLFEEVRIFLYRLTPPATAEQSIFDYLINTQQKMHDSLTIGRKKQNKTLAEDNYLFGNLSVGIDLGELQLVRVASPLIGNAFIPYWLSPPSVSPEFLHFVQQQPSHLYVNLMRRHALEGALSGALENLDLSFPEVYVVTLDKDSDFYWQKGLYAGNSVQSAEFKTLLEEKLWEPEGDFFWSRRLPTDSWRQQLQSILDKVHGAYFGDRAILSQQERLDFIELTYLAILDALVQTLQPTSMNISCRQTMDRGPSLMTLWLWQKNRVDEGQVAVMLLAPPTIIHQRSSHAPRISRFVSAAKRLKRV